MAIENQPRAEPIRVATYARLTDAQETARLLRMGGAETSVYLNRDGFWDVWVK